MVTKSLFFKLIGLIAFIALFSGCRSATPATPLSDATTFAGQVASSGAFIGIEISGDKLLAYVCDGTEETATLSEWFRGQLSGNSFNLTSSAGAQLSGVINANAASGTVTLADGRALNFTAPPAGGEAGLYRSEAVFDDARYVAGWIVLPDGQQRGSIVRWLLGGFKFTGVTSDTSTLFVLQSRRGISLAARGVSIW